MHRDMDEEDDEFNRQLAREILWPEEERPEEELLVTQRKARGIYEIA